MNKFVKFAALAATVLATTPALAAPVSVTGAPPSASARIIRPLTLTSTGSLNFGTIVLNGVTADRTVTVNPDASITCAAELVCAASGSVPTYNVQGTNNQVVSVIRNVSVLSGSNGGSLNLTPIGPNAANTVTLTNSGSPGTNFNVGGSITIGTGTLDGVYTGSVDVQVDYQ